MSTAAPVNSVILVHGGFVDGSGWQAVYNILTKDVLVGHSYGGAVITEAGLHGKVEVAASHSVFLSQPAVVADLIRQATAGSGSGRPLARVR